MLPLLCCRFCMWRLCNLLVTFGFLLLALKFEAFPKGSSVGIDVFAKRGEQKSKHHPVLVFNSHNSSTNSTSPLTEDLLKLETGWPKNGQSKTSPPINGSDSLMIFDAQQRDTSYDKTQILRALTTSFRGSAPSAVASCTTQATFINH